MADDKDTKLHTEYAAAHASRLASATRPAAVSVVVNPLQKRTHAELVSEVTEFCTPQLSGHIDTFIKAALVARSPDAYASIPELSSADVAALDYEREHKWAGTWTLYYAMGICALGAATQGWDQTGSNGANLSFPQEFGIHAEYGQPGGRRDEWIVGLINSAPYLAAAVIGCWLSDPLNSVLGRRGETFLTALCLIATPIASGFAKNWQTLFAVRLVMGIGVGAKAATVPIYAAELSPARIRGALTMGWQLWVCFGIFLGFAANVVVKDVGRIAWRLQLSSAFIPALPLALGIFFAPESPRWLMKKGRKADAYAAFNRLRLHPVIAARDLYYSYVLYEEERAQARGASYLSRLADCFRIPRIRRANLAASTVMLAQQMCGINIISFYSSTVFAMGGFSASQALYASLGFGATNFLFAIPAVFAIDTFGRRALLLSTFPFMALFLLATGLAFLMHDPQKRTGLAAAFIYIFTMFYSVGEGPVAFMYSAEVFPTIQREQGMAWAVCVNNFFAAVLGMTFPSMVRAFGITGSFCFYAGLNVVAFVWIFLWIPETKALTLEEIDDVFSIPTKTFITYETTVWLPHFLRRYVLRQNVPDIVPLLDKARIVDDDADEGSKA
ncbi:hypothetical protein Q8F55_007235 [Vanrija albida]|uniref:Major facilitator superfamily (MFS) profile domain-containing protein n=1 Tax=Vanrija albida TaxID=181172 RepID=A0ABR3PZD5_9TREE